MKLRQLEALRLVLARGTTKEAAEALGVTQSAVSRMVAQLEDEVGFSLFDRRHGRLHVTPEGQQFYTVAEKALSAIDQISATARDIKTLGAGALRIVAMPALGFGLLPPAIAHLREQYRNIRIVLDAANRSDVERGVAAGHYDLGVVTLPIEHELVSVEPLGGLEALCVVPMDHPLADKDVIHAQDLEGAPFISVEPGTLFRYRIDELFGSLGIQRDLRIEVQSTVIVCNLVAKGQGVSIVHRFIGENFEGRVAVRPFSPEIRFEYGLLSPVGQTRSAVAEAFADSLHSTLV